MRCFLLFFIALFGITGYALAQVPGYVNNQTLVPGSHIGDTTLSEYVAIRTIIIAGNRKTRNNIITREMSIAEGDMILRDSLDHILEINKKRLLNLSLFTDVTITSARVSQNAIDIFVLLKEQWYIFPEISFKLADRNLNVWWKEHDHDIRRANLGLALKHRNFRGNMETLSVSGQIGYTQKWGLEYFKPYLDRNQVHGAGFSLSWSNNVETYYITDSNKYRFVRTGNGKPILRQFTAALLYVYRPRYSTKHSLELRFRDNLVNEALVQRNPDYFLNGSNKMQLLEFTYRMDYNHVDNWNYPMTGERTQLQLVTRQGWEGIKFQQYLALQTGLYRKIMPKWYISSTFRGRATYPEKQPYIYRNAMGQDEEYVRGYEYYVIDGSQYGIVRNSLRYELLNIKLVNMPVKYLSTIPIRVYPKIFADAGYSRYQFPGNSFLNNRMLYSGGIGVDFVSTYDFKVRVEYAWNHLGEKGLFLHLSSE